MCLECVFFLKKNNVYMTAIIVLLVVFIQTKENVIEYREKFVNLVLSHPTFFQIIIPHSSFLSNHLTLDSAVNACT